MSLAKNAAAFTIMSDGIPIIYAGQEQHYSGGDDPDNREAVWLSGYNTESDLYKLIGQANAIRSQAIYRDSRYVTYNVSSIIPTIPRASFSDMQFRTIPSTKMTAPSPCARVTVAIKPLPFSPTRVQVVVNTHSRLVTVVSALVTRSQRSSLALPLQWMTTQTFPSRWPVVSPVLFIPPLALVALAYASLNMLFERSVPMMSRQSSIKCPLHMRFTSY